MTRVLISGFKHETNTFAKLPTDETAYRARAWIEGAGIAPAYAGTKTEIAAFMDACDRHGWQAIYGICADATPSGKVTRDVHDKVTSMIVDAATANGGADAVLLQLHGAMVAEHDEDGEGALLAALREAIGPDIPIAVTLDLHANVTDRMAALADIMVSYRTYPHVDQYEIATIAADLLARTLAGEITPGVTVARGAQLDGADHGRTTAPGPMLEALASADTLLAEPGVLAVSINAGFPWADIHDAGPTAVVVGDGADGRYAEMAAGLMDDLWETRHVATIGTISNAEAIAVARETGRVGSPVVIADFADNPGGGGYGDSTGLLRDIIDAGLADVAYGTLFDPECAAACHAAGEGAELTLALGGKVDPAFGPPVEATGTVTALAEGKFALEGPMTQGLAIECGPSAVFKVGGVEVVLTSKRFQNYDRMYFRHLGIEPAERAVLIVKSAQHFRAAYGPLASEVVVVDAGDGTTSHDLEGLTYENLRRPIWPLDDL